MLLQMPPLDDNVCPSFHGNSECMTVYDNNYVDDDAFAVVGETLEILMHNLKMRTVIVAKVFRKHALPINWKENKTEAVIDLRGPGSREAIRRIVNDHGATLRIDGGQVAKGAPDIHLRLVAY